MTIQTVPTADEENAIARRNAVLYAACQAFGGAAAPLNFALGAIAGSYLLGPDKALATAPVTGYTLGVALGALPAAMLMRAVGRKRGFMAGALIGIGGLLFATWALTVHSFWLFCMALMVNGFSGAFVQQYRFAAADRGTADFKAKAISWVLVGGIAAAVLGPQTVILTKDLLLPVPFAGAFLSGIALLVTSLIVMLFLAPSVPVPPVAGVAANTGRPLGEIIRQPRFGVAVLCGTAAYALMSLVMTAAPLAMIGCGFTADESTLGIQWHVLAMFGPSFFTGSLIARFGKPRIVATGLLILIACAVVALMGVELAHFWGALILLGIGWNFGFIGATAMVTETYRPEEKGKAQGANDFILFGTVAFASFASGQLLNAWGWGTVNAIVFPVVLISLGALVWLARLERMNAMAGEVAGR
ncbi:MFS transporter [Denitromonas halophila]|uniref:MFS transporter n=2 Tax=Denitromonas halophila TaxID=1629404 RepID=A0A557QFH6_9RHOO|nr:MFS transporter [Denitromonas halophila]